MEVFVLQILTWTQKVVKMVSTLPIIQYTNERIIRRQSDKLRGVKLNE